MTDVIEAADEWCDAYWHGRLSPHGDHGPVIALVDLARRQADLIQTIDTLVTVARSSPSSDVRHVADHVHRLIHEGDDHG